MHGLAHHVVAPEGERQVADAAADPRAGAGRLDLPRGLDEGDGVVVVLLEAGGHGQDVGVEDDVGRLDAGPGCQQVVGPLADGDLALDRVGLSSLVEGHHHHGSAVAAHCSGPLEELGLTLLQADRINDGLALYALEARLDDRPLRAVDHHRDTGNFGLGGDVVEEPGHAGGRVEHALVHVDVEDVGAAAHLIQGHLGRAGPVARRHQPCELARTGDVGALADHLEAGLGAQHQRLEPGHPGQGRLVTGARQRARGHALDGARDGRDVIGRGAAAAADDVHETAGGKVADEAGRLVRCLVILPEGVGQPCVRVAGDIAGGNAGQFGQVRPHVACAEGTVEPHRERLRVLHGNVERVECLARECSAAAVGNRRRNHDRQPTAPLCEGLLDAHERRLGVQRVDDGFNEQEVDAAVDETEGLVAVGVCHLVEGDRAEGRVVDVGREREHLRGRAHRPGDEAGPVGGAGRPCVGGGAGHPGPGDVQFVGQRFEAIVGLGDGIRAESAGLDDVGPGRQILLVNGADGVGPGEQQDVVVALQVVGVTGEPVAAKVGFRELQPLHHGAHGPVEDEDA